MSLVEGCGLTLTEGAVSKIRDILSREAVSSVFRVSVRGGGCAGFQYEFTTKSIAVKDEDEDEEEYYEDGDSDSDDTDEDDDDDDDEVSGGEDDFTFSDESGKPMLFVDRYSKKLLQNSTIDYVEDINGSRFVVNNPIARSGCGCGSSFSV